MEINFSVKITLAESVKDKREKCFHGNLVADLNQVIFIGSELRKESVLVLFKILIPTLKKEKNLLSCLNLSAKLLFC